MPESQEIQDLRRLLLEGVPIVKSRAQKCMSGTRTRILADIAEKIGGRDGKNIISILGAPGVGKSSLSLSATDSLRRRNLLVKYFRFDRTEAAETTPAVLWRHVAFGLANRLPPLQTRLLQELAGDKVDLDSAVDVFKYLIQEPLSNFRLPIDHPPLVTVVDGLDECGGRVGHLSSDRGELLQTLRLWSRLPSHFKLLVTSREEEDITRVLSPIGTQVYIPSGDVTIENQQSQASIDASNDDIRTLLVDRFRRIRGGSSELPADWPGRVTVARMVGRAAGNFLWATTAADFIAEGINPQSKLERIITHVPDSGPMKPLYSLYTGILEVAFGNVIGSDSEEGEVLRAVLGIMVLAKRPFDIGEYTDLLTSDPATDLIPSKPAPKALKLMLGKIRNALSSVIAPDAKLHFRHKTFYDFLLAQDCPTKYKIQEDKYHSFLTELCLMTMKNGLRFNLCGLGTSFLRNSDVPDIQLKIAKDISPVLSYSCCYWADHLSHSRSELPQAKDVLMDKLLYWFEAMSLLKEIKRIPSSLRLLSDLLRSSGHDDFEIFVHDAHRFIGAFGQVIAQSAPHIYISALTFAPTNSPVANQFRSRFPQVFTLLEQGRVTDWSPYLFTSEHHQDWVSSVAFSPDEKSFVSGSADGTICKCDSETGNLISPPFRVVYPVSSVFFDPDGRHVWASCPFGKVFRSNDENDNMSLVFQAGTHVDPSFCCFDDRHNIVCASRNTGEINLWHADSRRLQPLHIDDTPNSVSFSPDGCRIACLGSKDVTPRFWNLVHGDHGDQLRGLPVPEPEPKHDEPISVLSFSADGDYAASGSTDGTILIWDVKTGGAVSNELLVTGKEEVDAVAYYHDSNAGLVVSASGYPCTVNVWNASTHKKLLGPLEGHTSWITTIALSRNGQRALTASKDKTVRMWDLGMRNVGPAIPAHEPHEFKVDCLAFSPCGQKLASIDRRRIRVWDTNTLKPLLRRPISSASFNRIIFSPDGRQIVAYDSEDGTMRVWNAETGRLVLHHESNNHDQEGPGIDHLSFGATDQLFALSSDGVVHIWTLENSAMIELTTLHPEPVDGRKPAKILALSPDCSTAIVCDDQRNPRHYIWSVMPSQPLPPSLTDEGDTTHDPIVYSPSGKYVAATRCGDQNTTLRIWKSQTGELVAKPSTLDGRVHLLVFSPNDRHIAYSSTADSTVIWILDTDTSDVVPVPWRGHTSDITAIAFSPDGKNLVSGSDDGYIRIWDTADLSGNSHVSVDFLGTGNYLSGEGWVMDAKGMLLFWVPNDRRAGLWWPRTVAILGGSRPPTKLDLTGFKYGKNWVDCFERERTNESSL